MKFIDKTWLRAHGVDLPNEDLAALASRVEEVLEIRVGTKIAELLDDAQIKEFERLVEREATEEEQIDLLERLLPSYKEIVKRETARLKRNISRASDPASYIRSLDV